MHKIVDEDVDLGSNKVAQWLTFAWPLSCIAFRSRRKVWLEKVFSFFSSQQVLPCSRILFIYLGRLYCSHRAQPKNEMWLL